MKEKRPFRERIIEEVRLMGQMLIDNAEDLVGQVPLISSFRIELDFPMGADKVPVPTATVKRVHLPRFEDFEKTYYITEEDKK